MAPVAAQDVRRDMLLVKGDSASLPDDRLPRDVADEAPPSDIGAPYDDKKWSSPRSRAF
jgi:hypothetical protein